MSGESLRKTEFPVFNGYAPAAGGPKAIPIVFDFTVASEIDFDLIAETTAGIIDFVQSIWVDNATNPNALRFTFSQTGQRLVVPANAQGIWPVIAPSGLRCRVQTTPGGALLITCILLNVPMPMTQYGPIAVNIAAVNANMVPTAGTATDHSSTIAVGGTSQALFAANGGALRRIVYNPSLNAESLYVNFGGVAAAAGDSFEVMPGGYYDTGLGPVDRTAWTINNLTVNAQPYVAKEYV